MSDKKTEILDNFHTAMSQLSYANLRFHCGNTIWAVDALKETKEHIDKLIQEIKDE